MAKYLTRSLVGCSGLDMETGPCHVHFTGFPHGAALCRTTLPVQTITPCQPTSSYYCWRNAATALDDFYGSEFPVSFSDGNDIICFTLESGDKKQLMVAAWLNVPLADSITERRTDVILPGISVKQAWVIDIFNGTEQELNIWHTGCGSSTVLKNMLIKDYPVLIRLQMQSE